MKLRHRFCLLLGLKFALMVGLAVVTASLFQNQQALSKAQQMHFRSYQLADELRQSSDDLSRLARAFVATGEAEFERQYWAALDIRNGRMPRPVDYHRIYWDLVTKDQPKPRPDGAAVSLHELMAREGFTAAELALLASARQHSDALVQTEQTAINAAKGLFDDGAGSFTVQGPPDRARAISLLNDEAYRDHKARIMQPIDDFYVMLAGRTAGEVSRLEQSSRRLLAASGASIVTILGLFVFSFVTLWRQMLERERAEVALRETEARTRILGDNLPSGMIYQLEMGPDGKERRFSYVSAGVEKLHEFTAAAIMEDAGLLYRQIVPEDRPLVAEREAAALAAMQPFQAEFRTQLRSGSIRWSLVTSAPRRAANGQIFWDGIELDITERKRLEQGQSELALIVDSSSDAIMSKTLTGIITSWNRGAEKLFGYTAAEAIGRPMLILFPPERVAEEADILARITHGETVDHFETERLRKDGRRIAISVTISPLRDTTGRVVGASKIARDITEIQRARETLRKFNVELERQVALRTAELAARNREIEVLLEREHQISNMKSQFMTLASHEFRTPLSAAVASLELLERHAGRLPEAKRVELITRIQTALARLTSIMNDMIMLSRADSGQVKAARMEVDLARFVADVVQKAEAADRQQHVFSFRQVGVPGVVTADTSLLHHILSNLLKNAVLYSPVQSRISVTLEFGQHAFSLEITDEGIGIPEADRGRIFEPFVRGSNIGHIGGTGLGLSIAQRYVGLLGGRIELLPVERGTTIHLSIPLQPSLP